MTTFVALLRAVNVSGQNKIPMAELRRALGGLGLTGVETYLQSGNVVFDAQGDDPAQPGERAERAGSAIYLYRPHGYGRTKLNNAYFERALGTPATTRNWRTVLALSLIHISEPTRLGMISYAVFCLKKQ